ncbi:MAG: phospho-N-acetylmuramoyl-pentapeptide-transferase [Clostridia bacterium]|nr:phospho-N-acetylmuramoyl-pentapeptide-transferase [Clostridia bacterium]
MDVIIMLTGAVVAFGVTALLGFWMIPYLRKLKFGQTILSDGPAWHQSKQGTPVMGGLMFIIGILIALAATVVVAILQKDNRFFNEFISHISQDRLQVIRVGAGLIMALASGAIGFMDDYIKVVKKQNLGLTVKQKTLLQLLVAAAFLATLALTGDLTTNIPFVGIVDVSKGIGLLYWPIALMFIYGFMNAVNLTDGVDGLCSSVTLVVSVFFLLFSGILAVNGLSLLACCSAGGLAGFLVWNLKPAKVFMGDTGSLFLGGLVCAMAFASGYPVLLLLAGIIYLAEAFSDILQVAYYKKTKKRIFKMAPIHHHFEMCGWSENQIVVIFSLVTVVGCLAAGALYYFGK